ncbi:probable E3 ubiquitin-protein ligase RNF144A-A isoform X1 [Oncorhynchus tshawytscha]|uniref:RBR-type E3 ubiquitin transferase n=1 Tax=Oncorhynchus tshawytscha TaxID=74940 RepID=A0AAZ3Q4T9_ONCTS|nr:probable E3 ubiquitin-protein ligase RNF144A-A isoform X1 [Oncorhynchus tshawytscha]XP_024293463.1 probable E3 ubiquitin-protein ligase RNF144A-A isoform X1 [Oncorhynchus tshawytscha]XP_024293464.1 probable E3 ubiquitin-protein ligase RNF144A-A isoform X1 [Oncorhynchus tshawytscha]XP_024293465.1 probable E3 ubiquitin-protein ligase RNF144A-A isoform X1 [Oncorhynchus tshawytscha]XP_024293466.1 probable E3 ubiquitin-protein ligase RNF144A-A isoform X1 [Oncorhynchus tshawytscha]XP_024293467.1 
MTTARYRPTWDLALDPLVSCKLCLGEFPLEQMTTITQCQCVFCTLCLKQYVELLIKEGLETAISCPDSACPERGHLLENEIECMVASEVMQRHKKLQFEREVLLDPCLMWCPSSSCQAVCQLKETEVALPQLVQCAVCTLEFCSACKANWHPGQACPPPENNLPITAFLPGETSSFYKSDDDDGPIKRCPKCKVYIERDEGCAQMMCKNCKHAFCWYCLESLDDDFLLIHFDKGPCRNKLGHSRSSVIWHRTQMWVWECQADEPEMKALTPNNNPVIYHPPAAVLCLEGLRQSQGPAAGSTICGLHGDRVPGAEADGLSGANEVRRGSQSQALTPVLYGTQSPNITGVGRWAAGLGLPTALPRPSSALSCT